MRRPLRLAVSVFVAAVALVATPHVACAQEHEGESAAGRAYRGPDLGLGVVLVLPSRDAGPWGSGLRLDGAWGIQVGPAVLSPGGRLAGYVLSERFVGLAMPTFRVTVPVGPVAPFLMGGVGVGWLSNEPENGLGLLGGGGLMIHFGRMAALGVEATYQNITGTEFHSLTIGPSISLFGG